MTVTAEELDFYRIEGSDAPIYTCSNCGRRDKSAGWAAADILIDDDEDGDHVSVLICSEKCFREFLTRPTVDDYLASLVNTVLSVR